MTNDTARINALLAEAKRRRDALGSNDIPEQGQ